VLPDRAHVGETFSKNVTLTEAEIKHFATLCDDQNPLHHDSAYAAKTRFGQIIACGPHYSSLFVAMTATHFSKTTPGVGLEFNLKFLRPVYANIALTMTWTVTKIQHKERLAGTIVWLEGKITDQDGRSLVTGDGKLLLTENL
jgi:3-hydroxybutyryl-CoA dehydratase